MIRMVREVNDWNKNKLLGNSAEKIVEFLINSMPNWKCNEFGVENHIKDIKEMVRETINPVTNKIRKMPDVVAFNKKTKETFFIEVKYFSNSAKGKYILNYLEEYNEYWEGTKLIIVRKDEPHFLYIDLGKINNSMRTIIPFGYGGESRISWDFTTIEQGIKDLFPDLKDEDIKEAEKHIGEKS